MDNNSRSPVILVVLTNIFIACVTQAFYVLMAIDNKDYIHLSIVPLIIVSFNLILWFSGFRITFYQHWVCAYIAYICSIFVFYFIHYIHLDLSDWIYFPPGEAYWDLFLFSFVTSFFQLIIMFFLNFVTYLLYRIAS